MKAVAFVEGLPTIVERPDPAPVEGEARVAVTCAGICGTDLEIAQGYLGFSGIPGHEFVGRVEHAADPAWIGRRVVGEINVGCRHCKACSSGWARHCPDRTVLGIVERDGAFAELLSLPLVNLHQIPDAVPDDAAVFVEPLAAAWAILEQVPLRPRARTAVLGDGRLGQLCAMVLADAGAEVTAVGKHPKKLARLGNLGLRTAVEPCEMEHEFELVIEATGRPEGLRHALDLVRPRGTVVLKSTYHGDAAFALAGVVIDEISVVGSRCGLFPPAIEQLVRAPSLLDGMISARFDLDRVDAAFEMARQPDTLKVLLDI